MIVCASFFGDKKRSAPPLRRDTFFLAYCPVPSTSPSRSLQESQQWQRTPFPGFLPALVGATWPTSLFQLIVQLQRPDSRVVSRSACVAEKTPLQQPVLRLPNLNGRFRFSYCPERLIHSCILSFNELNPSESASFTCD